MGKKRTTLIGDFLSEEDQQKQERAKRQKEAAKAAKIAQKAPAEAPKAHIAGQKGGERVKDLSTEILAEAEEVEKKLKAAQDAGQLPEKKLRQAKTRGKIYKAARSKVGDRTYPLPEALKLLRDISYAKMDGTIELHLSLTDKGTSVTVELPFAAGRAKRVAVADDATLARIENNQIDFDILVASPAQMGKLVKFAKTLGPRGLMPNPKNGTVSADPEATARKMAASASVTLKTEKDAPVVHTVVGKLSQKDEELVGNIRAILTAFGPKLVRITLKSTMSPGIRLEIPKA